MHIRIIQSIALLSLLQAVFSKRSADSLQLYLTTTSDNTDSGANNNSASISTSTSRASTTNYSSARVSNNNRQSQLNTFYLKKRGMAFVHSKVRETRERSRTYSTSSGTGNIPKPFQYFNNNNHGAGTGTGMFTSLLSGRSSGPSSRSRSSSKLNLSFNLSDSWKKICGDDGDGNNGDEETCDVPADLESNLEPRLEKKVSNINNIKNNNNNNSDDDETSPSRENLSMPWSKDFPLASLINVEALLMASGKFPNEPESDDLLVDMVNGSTSTTASTATAKATTSDSDSNGADVNDNNDEKTPKKTRTSLIPRSTADASWETFFSSFQKSIKDLVDSPKSSPTSSSTSSSTSIITTFDLDTFLQETTSTFSPDRVQSLIRTLALDLSVNQNADVFKQVMDGIVATAEKLAREQGVNVSEAAAQARATTKFTAEFLQMANGILLSGYVQGDGNNNGAGGAGPFVDNVALARQVRTSLGDGVNDADASLPSKPLFHKFPSVTTIPSSEYDMVAMKGAEMAQLSGAIYEDTLPRMHKAGTGSGHSMVVNATTADVIWMISDSIGYESDFVAGSSSASGSGSDGGAQTPILIRTVTIRGFDASDENVDRERLLNQICAADPVPLTLNDDDDDVEKSKNAKTEPSSPSLLQVPLVVSSPDTSSSSISNLRVHRGLLGVARQIYADIMPYLDVVGPNHKIVLTGHSIGGALSNLVLFLMTVDRGNVFVQERVKKVFTFGSPPIATVKLDGDDVGDGKCAILEELGLPSDLVHGYIQPWDPIPRWFSRIDPLYPLIGDLGSDGVTPYISGPPRTLRPIVRTILETWENWSTFRENYRDVLEQDYVHIGARQFLLMPDPGRYLTDRLVTVNINAHPVEEVLSVSSEELYDALMETFPIDIFTVSLVPNAIRSFIHHFYPAYTEGFEGYVSKKMEEDVEEQQQVAAAASAAISSSTPQASDTAIAMEKEEDNDINSTDNDDDDSRSRIEKEITEVKNLRGPKSNAAVDFADQLGIWVLGGNNFK